MMLNMQLTGNAINPEKTKYYIKYNNAWNTRLSTVFYYDITLGKDNLITKTE
jgi:hypothetical protein